MKVSIQSDSAKLELALAQLALAARVDLGRVIKQEGGNVAKSIMMIMPPTASSSGTDGGPPKTSGLSKAAQQQGENAIKSDLFGGKRKSNTRYASVGLFQRIGSSTLVPPKGGVRHETAGVNLGWERSKTIRFYFKYWMENASSKEMSTFHKRFRNAYGRTGYVSRSTIGRWKVQDQMWISNAAADAYLKEVQRRVGWSKAGFAAAAMACGIRVPAWVRRHASAAGKESHDFKSSTPFITGVATAIKIPNADRYIQAALEFRTKITYKKIDAILANRAVNLGFAKVSGAGVVEERMPA